MGISEFFIVVGLLFANAFFVAAEFALVKVRGSQVDGLVQKGSWAARVTRNALDHLDAYISASQVGITLASLGLGFVIEDSVTPLIEHLLEMVGLPGDALVVQGKPLPIIPGLSFLLVTFLHIALGELVPKSLAIRSAKPVALITAPPLVGFYYLFFPVIWLLNTFSDLILKLLGQGGIDSEEVAHTEEELRQILIESTEKGHLTGDERKMIENVLNLEEKTAKRVMIPRPDIVYLSLHRSYEENMRMARRGGHTRYPLCEDDLTNVIGMIHVKDLFRSSATGDERPDLRKIVRKVPFLPESRRLDHLLREFQRNRVHLAMLLDEYGSVVGMVTLENVLEELVGPIEDEFDHESPLIETLENGAFEVDASCPVDQLAQQCGVAVPKEIESETTGGLILEQLGRLATIGDDIVLGNHRLIVVQAEPTRIRMVRVETMTVDVEESAVNDQETSQLAGPDSKDDTEESP